ncbi:MAG: hypothetical protein ACQETH_15545, partial [Candidatus Rifleibacteriota bacterium]
MNGLSQDKEAKSKKTCHSKPLGLLLTYNVIKKGYKLILKSLSSKNLIYTLKLLDEQLSLLTKEKF